MFPWLLGGYTLFVILIAGYAAHVALSNPDRARRSDGYKVLRVVWGTGITGLAIISVRLHAIGLL